MDKIQNVFTDYLSTSFVAGVLKSGTEIELPYYGIGFFDFVKENYKKWGYETLLIIDCPILESYDVIINPFFLKDINSKSLVVVSEINRSHKDIPKELIKRIEATNCTYIITNVKTK